MASTFDTHPAGGFDIASIPRSEIPGLIAALLARLTEPAAPSTEAAPLLDANQLAAQLGVPASWIREQAVSAIFPL
jgi:hypothetical protein